MGYYSASERNVVLVHILPLVVPEDFMLEETGQSQRDQYFMVVLIQGSDNIQNPRDTRLSGGCPVPEGGSIGTEGLERQHCK